MANNEFEQAAGSVWTELEEVRAAVCKTAENRAGAPEVVESEADGALYYMLENTKRILAEANGDPTEEQIKGYVGLFSKASDLIVDEKPETDEDKFDLTAQLQKLNAEVLAL